HLYRERVPLSIWMQFCKAVQKLAIFKRLFIENFQPQRRVTEIIDEMKRSRRRIGWSFCTSLDKVETSVSTRNGSLYELRNKCIFVFTVNGAALTSFLSDLCWFFTFQSSKMSFTGSAVVELGRITSTSKG
uniref:Uncharacterized protein n=1 Tax=Parascaris univalens TaxID=6257 RepID=A0A915CF07_PARUN